MSELKCFMRYCYICMMEKMFMKFERSVKWCGNENERTHLRITHLTITVVLSHRKGKIQVTNIEQLIRLYIHIHFYTPSRCYAGTVISQIYDFTKSQREQSRSGEKIAIPAPIRQEWKSRFQHGYEIPKIVDICQQSSQIPFLQSRSQILLNIGLDLAKMEIH